MKILRKKNPMPTIDIRLTKHEFEELLLAVNHYHDYLGGCTAPTLARKHIVPLMRKLDAANAWI